MTGECSSTSCDDRKWPNPVVLKLTQGRPALTPLVVETLSANWKRSRFFQIEANLIQLDAGFDTI